MALHPLNCPKQGAVTLKHIVNVWENEDEFQKSRKISGVPNVQGIIRQISGKRCTRRNVMKSLKTGK